MDTEETEPVLSLQELMDQPGFNVGAKMGRSFGELSAYEEAQRAFDAGEIELWLGQNKPKTEEEWDAWYAEHPEEEMKDRWSKD